VGHFTDTRVGVNLVFFVLSVDRVDLLLRPALDGNVGLVVIAVDVAAAEDGVDVTFQDVPKHFGEERVPELLRDLSKKEEIASEIAHIHKDSSNHETTKAHE
jgi:hypothetical protein